jgi:hypothetical protein
VSSAGVVSAREMRNEPDDVAFVTAMFAATAIAFDGHRDAAGDRSAARRRSSRVASRRVCALERIRRRDRAAAADEAHFR